MAIRQPSSKTAVLAVINNEILEKSLASWGCVLLGAWLFDLARTAWPSDLARTASIGPACPPRSGLLNQPNQPTRSGWFDQPIPASCLWVVRSIQPAWPALAVSFNAPAIPACSVWFDKPNRPAPDWLDLCSLASWPGPG